ncbi:MAG: hypothetical protein UZ15_CFX003000840 [Chloroflexi bacterium OLB15]|nr:MAG: hypothetical protein UZ15_CFX003000840 [Chloroflexi bacterium OLB15]
MSQIGIALSALGVVLAFMGLFPGITGIITGQGIGIFQFTAVLTGFGLLNLGALIYVKFTIYAAQASNLAQQVGIRLALTGLVLAGMAGFADVLGFGSHGITQASETFFGGVQALLVIVCFLISAVGVLIYAVLGAPPPDPEA